MSSTVCEQLSYSHSQFYMIDVGVEDSQVWIALYVFKCCFSSKLLYVIIVSSWMYPRDNRADTGIMLLSSSLLIYTFCIFTAVTPLLDVLCFWVVCVSMHYAFLHTSQSLWTHFTNHLVKFHEICSVDALWDIYELIRFWDQTSWSRLDQIWSKIHFWNHFLTIEH